MNENLDDCYLSPNKWKCPVEECGKILSRKQTLKTHLKSIHDVNGMYKKKF